MNTEKVMEGYSENKETELNLIKVKLFYCQWLY
jgi:hypothetical protein